MDSIAESIVMIGDIGMNDKALLVMDETENCVDCQFCYEHDEGIEAWCIIAIDPYNEDSYREMEEDYCQCKPYWCPLKPMPEKKEAFEIPKIPSFLDFRRKGFRDGWNACIDAITGGKNND